LIEQELDKNDQPSRLLPERVIGLSALNEKFGSKSQVVNHLLSLEQVSSPLIERAISSFFNCQIRSAGPERPSLFVGKRETAEAEEQARKNGDLVRRLAESGAPKESFSAEFLGLNKGLSKS